MMEGSGAGLAGGGQAGGDAGQGQAAADGQQAQALDAGSIQQALESMQGGQEQLRQQLGQMGEFLQQQPWQQAEQDQPAEQDAPLDLSFLQDPMLEPQQVAERLTEVINQQAQTQAQQMIQQHVSPLEQSLNEMRLERGAEALVAEFPEMGQPEVANEVVNNARQYADLLKAPELANNPAFWRLVYAAGRAFDSAAQEQQPGAGAPGAAHLEGGAGATPGAPQVDLGDMIVRGGGSDAPLGRGVLPFG
jgi:hypothetical protein